MIVSSGSGLRYKNLAHFMIRWSRHGISGAFNVFVVFALLDFHFSNVALKCSPLAAWMLDNCRQVFVVLIWVHACTDRVFGILSIVVGSAFRLSLMMHWPSANFMLDDVAPL